MSIVQVMKKLVRLDFCAKQITVTPDFSFAPYLEELTLTNCERMTEVHDSVGTLENLKSLWIKGRNALEGLPKEIEKLTQLRYLTLEKSCPGRGNFRVGNFRAGKSKWEISSSSSELVTALSSSFLCSVGRLVITDDQIEALPDCIAQMQKLWYLELKCQSLKALPKWIGQLKQLHTFSVDCDNIPPFIDEMCSWEHIEIWLKFRCVQLEPVTSSIEELKNVKSIELGCSSPETLPAHDASLGGLRELSLSRCKNIRCSLDLSEIGIVELLPWLGCFTNLAHLKLSNITQNDVLLSGLSHLTSLEELDLSGSNFKSLPSCISSFSRLQWLNVSGCKQLHTIPHLSSSFLWKLDASNCTNLRALPDFSNLQSLRYLFLGGCNSLDCIPGFETIAENIERLKLPGPSGGIQCSNLSNDFKNKVLKRALFRCLGGFKMGGNILAGPHNGQQSLSFFCPDVRFNKSNRCGGLKLILDGMISSPVDMAVVIEDHHVLFEMRLTGDDFDNDEGSNTFSFEEELLVYDGGHDGEIVEHLEKGSGAIVVSTDVSKLSRVELQVTYCRHEPLPRWH